MAQVRYALPGEPPVVVGAEAADALIASGRGDAALLYLYILRRNGVFVVSDAAGALHRTNEETEQLAQSLCAMGLLRREGDRPEPEAAPAPDRQMLEQVIATRGGEFADLVGEVEQALGRVLSAPDTMALLNIYQQLGMPPEVILLLVNHCCQRYAAKYGPGRKPTLRAIEKEAYVWEREGALSLDTAEAYLRGTDLRETKLAEFAAVLKLDEPTLTETARKYLTDWIGLGFGPEAAEVAYDRTVMGTGKLSWKYMNAIFQSWHRKGLHTPAEIAAGDTPGAGTKQRRTASGRTATAAEVEQNRRVRKLIEED